MSTSRPSRTWRLTVLSVVATLLAGLLAACGGLPAAPA
jgi:hypothetical protein